MNRIARIAYVAALSAIIYLCACQKGAPAVLDISGGWKFMAADSLQFAEVELPDADWSAIQTGQSWEKQGHENLDGFAWYRLHVTIPSRLSHSAILEDSLVISLGKIDDYDQTYLNGRLIGCNGRSLPSQRTPDQAPIRSGPSAYSVERRYVLSFTDPRIVWDGDNVLAVRVLDTGGEGGFYSGQPYVRPTGILDYLTTDLSHQPYFIQNGRVGKTFSLSNISDRHMLQGRLAVTATAKMSGAANWKHNWPIRIAPQSRQSIEFSIPEQDESCVLEYHLKTTSGEQWSLQQETPYILTPAPAAAPRINGARLFGVRPGSPFLFTIPATGVRPISYAAEGLPPGLALDGNTGQISGRLMRAGEYQVVLQAGNASGIDRKPLRIVCGENLALTPHMGWNSWYVWENNVTDEIMRKATDAMVTTGMIDHGYMYVNIDDCWSVKPGSDDPSLQGPARDRRGAINSNPRFPDMKAMTDYIHAKGLKAGIYTSPGPLTCAGHVAAFEHEALDVQRYVAWGFDFLKYDWCSYRNIAQDKSEPELQKPYRLISEILRQQKRDIVLNLCQYGMGQVWRWGRQVGGHSWRTAGDLGGNFADIGLALFRDGFDVYTDNDLHLYGGPGGWNDPDYLLLGYLSNWKGQTMPTPLTPDEQYTHVSLWSLVAAPLIFSGDMTRLDNFTLNLLCNDEVIEVDQDPLGRPGRRVSKKGDLEVWMRELADGAKAVGLFNRGPEKATMSADWNDVAVTGSQLVRDLWRQKNLGAFEGTFQVPVPAHGVVLIRMTPAGQTVS